MTLHRCFRYRMELSLRFNSQWEWRYVVEGRDGAVEFWARSEPSKTPFGSGYYGGVEMHRASPPDADSGPPDHGRCSALSDRACWHDGSSLYAEESWIPFWIEIKKDHERVFERLVMEYRQRFAAPDTETKP